ncbi:hypothetical protein [Flexivirga caeni]|uniref:Uncharacterized protein n=1 Tax=Flexivirga caeni TaxID=2294115 RepID=A0A3M9M901_9MICO|nr:hypothetical protein [Flexivirga caeni]RNI21353.1 hypothetical protein EFY87_11790 [Flexivirga caeni]
MTRILGLHRDRATALAIAIGAAVVLLLMTDIGAGAVSWMGLLCTVIGCVILVSNSDSFAGLLLLGAMVAQWLFSGVGSTSWLVLPAAWLLLIAHVLVALAGSGPDQAAIPRAIVASWTRRTVLVGLATTVVGALALLIEPANSALVPYGVAAALAGLVVATLVTLRLTAGTETPGSGQ